MRGKQDKEEFTLPVGEEEVPAGAKEAHQVKEREK